MSGDIQFSWPERKPTDPDTEMAGDDEQGPWVAVKQVCTICGNKHVSVHPVNMVRNGECPECNNFTCEDIEE